MIGHCREVQHWPKFDVCSVGSNHCGLTCSACYNTRFTEVPGAPEGPIVYEEILATSVVVRWKPPKDTGGIPITAYHLERRDKKYYTWIKVEKTKPNITSFCVQNLLEGNEYLFRVFAENEEGLSVPLESIQSVIPHRPPGCWICCAGWLRLENKWFSHLHIILLMLTVISFCHNQSYAALFAAASLCSWYVAFSKTNSYFFYEYNTEAFCLLHCVTNCT